ncbi:hypothetical protein [Arthrobacter rhizosphaerae]|uniref:hypothetical protein n=1 Tax=Arthrobacter rhizosphaerae TaxID=2855490 RepID=UPI001FF22B9E|nr:hypothetical protein [Arthrobacter rhizosphaerae]
MPGESGERLTLSVGRREFEELAGAWAAYLQATKSLEAVDPVLAMQRTGGVLRAVEQLMNTLESGTRLAGTAGEDAQHCAQI